MHVQAPVFIAVDVPIAADLVSDDAASPTADVGIRAKICRNRTRAFGESDPGPQCGDRRQTTGRGSHIHLRFHQATGPVNVKMMARIATMSLTHLNSPWMMLPVWMSAMNRNQLVPLRGG